jgi:hypothetical protein
MSDLLKQPSNVMYQLQQLEPMKYRVTVEGLGVIGTLRIDGPTGKPAFHYENDRVSGIKTEVGEAARALYYSKLG